MEDASVLQICHRYSIEMLLDRIQETRESKFDRAPANYLYLLNSQSTAIASEHCQIENF